MKVFTPEAVHQPLTALGALRASERFAHSSLLLNKYYPDTALLMERRGFTPDWIAASEPFQVNLYALDIDWLDPDLLWHPTLNWHQQQWGIPGLVAAAGAVIDGSGHAFVSLLQSDLLQQVSKFPRFKAAFKSRLDNRFGRWCPVLCNALLDRALDLGLARVHFPTADAILSHIRKRVDPTIYRRIYDSIPKHFRCTRTSVHGHDYWTLTPSANRDRIARLAPAPAATDGARKTVCILHDIEGNIDTNVSPQLCRENLHQMLAIEARYGVTGGYSILGTLFNDCRQLIEASGGHAIAFHSYYHDPSDPAQLQQVRELDLQVKGYRPPRSAIGEDLSDARLNQLNFEWFASSCWSFGFERCRVENGLAKIPVLWDDWPLQSNQLDYANWCDRLLREIANSDYYCLGLHDCYAQHWLHDYAALLDQIAALGAVFRTPAELAAEAYIEAGRRLGGRLAKLSSWGRTRGTVESSMSF